MTAMSRKKDQLSLSIEIYKGILETNKQLTSELKSRQYAKSLSRSLSLLVGCIALMYL